MDEIQQWNFKTLAEVFCNNNGSFNSSELTCNCDMGYFGVSCEKSGLDVWGNWWTALQVVFTFFFGCMTILLILQLKKNLLSEHGRPFKVLYRLFFSPKYVVILNLLVISVSLVLISKDNLRWN